MDIQTFAEFFENSDSLVKSVIIDFLIQWVGFLFAFIFNTEKFYDLFGSLSYLLLVCLNFKWHNKGHRRQEVQSFCIFIWALRLGLYLFIRVLKTGKDRRFDDIKANPIRFFGAWTIQGVWVFVTLLPTLLALKAPRQVALTPRDYIGWGLWTLGFLLETVADYQKSSFRNDPANKDKFINVGLWSVSRHPNYLGEILLWFGLYISASSVFNSTQYLTVFCPVLDYLLITRVSGLPPLEKYGAKKWGHLPQYQEYLRNTPALIPFWR